MKNKSKPIWLDLYWRMSKIFVWRVRVIFMQLKPITNQNENNYSKNSTPHNTISHPSLHTFSFQFALLMLSITKYLSLSFLLFTLFLIIQNSNESIYLIRQTKNRTHHFYWQLSYFLVSCQLFGMLTWF